MKPKELAKILREEADYTRNPKLADSAWVGMLTLADELESLADDWGHALAFTGPLAEESGSG